MADQRLHEPEFRVLLERPGRSPLELTPLPTSVRFSSAALGGFGGASFSLPGDQRRDLPYLSTMRLLDGDHLLWEGRVEDVDWSVGEGEVETSVECFGFRRLLEDASVKRVWLLRSIPWRPSWNVTGLAAVGADTPVLRTDIMFTTVGQIDPTDLTVVGVLIDNYGTATGPAGASNWAVYIAPSGISLVKSYVTVYSGATGRPFIQDSVSGSAWNALYGADPAVPTDVTNTHTANARYLIAGSCTTGTGYNATLYNWRILCAISSEDAAGGFYGGTILRDLIALVPGLQVGNVDAGTDFLIQAISRVLRDQAVSVVQEVSSYYRREWGVWEDKRFDWVAPNLDEAQWVANVTDCKQLQIRGSVEGIVKTVYLLYEDAATGEPGEQSSTSTDQRNPFVRQGLTKDETLQAPVVMTSNSASQLATRVASDHGNYPIVSGRAVFLSKAVLRNAVGSYFPARWIRAGQNIVFPDLPKDDLLRPGRDGQTLFHITSAETNMESGETVLEFEGYTRQAEILLARIAAVTQVLTGG